MNNHTDNPKKKASIESGNELDESKKPTILEVIFSVMAAFVGIQSRKNKERDFKHGNFKVFVVVAAAFTLLFLITIIAIVQLVTN
ncbi:MAG: hypothetical protein ACI89U_002168 [Gammaproteobacteria bacterium]|jgi:hypothetical protein